MGDSEFLALMLSKYPADVFVGRVTEQVRLYRRAWDALREHIWERDRGQCVQCHETVFLEKGLWKSMHAAHIRSKGAGNDDLPSNVRTLCLECHHKEHQGTATRPRG